MSAPTSSKKVCFFKDGDVNFSGINLTVSQRKYNNIDALFSELNNKVPLPFGVRSIHTPGGTNQINRIEDIEEGRHYVCSSYKKIKKVEYTNKTTKKPFTVPRPRSKFITRPENNTEDEKQPKLFTSRVIGGHPKVITFISKEDTRNTARFLLNPRLTDFQTVLEQASFALRLNSGPISSLFTLEGKQVSII